MAKWSEIWSSGMNRYQRDLALHAARFTPPSAPVSKSGGGVPSHQPGKFVKRAAAS